MYNSNAVYLDQGDIVDGTNLNREPFARQISPNDEGAWCRTLKDAGSDQIQSSFALYIVSVNVLYIITLTGVHCQSQLNLYISFDGT